MQSATTTRRHLALIGVGGLLALCVTVAHSPDAQGMALPAVVASVRDSRGVYVTGGASLAGADCSGLVSVAQSLAMGEPIRRLGSTHTLLAGRWPHAIRGASPDDLFVIGVSPTHMVAQIEGTRIEARSPGQPFLIGDAAASPWDHQFVAQYRIDPAVLVL